jgi:hypothetical protein
MSNKRKLMSDINEIIEGEFDYNYSIKILPQSRNKMMKFDFDGRKVMTVSIVDKERKIRFIIDFVNKEIEIITNLENKIIVQKLEEVIKKMAKKEAMENLY